MTIKIRNVDDKYERFNEATNTWVSITRDEIRVLEQKGELIHWNPRRHRS